MHSIGEQNSNLPNKAQILFVLAALLLNTQQVQHKCIF